jgi:TonB family protein
MKDQITKVLAVIFTSALLATSATEVSGLSEIPSQQEIAPVKAVAPVYPLVATAAGVSGLVIVEVQVDQQGVVTSVRTVDGPKLLRGAAEKCASRWLFAAPADKSLGTRVVHLSFLFTLVRGDPLSEELVPIFIPPYHVEVKGTKPNLIQRVDSDPPMSKQRSQPRKNK